MLHRLRHPELADQAWRDLPDPADLGRLKVWMLQRGLPTMTRLARWVAAPESGGSPCHPPAGASGRLARSTGLWRRADGFSALRANGARGLANPGARQATPLRRPAPRIPGRRAPPGVARPAGAGRCATFAPRRPPGRRVWRLPAGPPRAAARRAQADPRARRRRSVRDRWPAATAGHRAPSLARSGRLRRRDRFARRTRRAEACAMRTPFGAAA